MAQGPTPPATLSSSRPSTLPATTPTTARTAVVPPGFTSLTIDGTRVLVQEADQPWVSEALTSMRPATRPTTMPSDLLAGLAAQRPQLLKQMTADLALGDSKAATAVLDEQITPLIQKMDRLHVPLVYLVCTKDKLKQLLRDGWQDPKFRYNRVADDVSYSQSISMSTEGPMDDVIVPAIYNETADKSARIDSLIKMVHNGQTASEQSISLRSRFLVHAAFFDFVTDQAMKPLKLQPDEQWFAQGVAGVLSSRYSALVSGMSAPQLIQQLIREDRREPVKTRTLDALHPTPLEDLRRELVPFYIEAVRRKGMAAVDHWLNQAGDASLPKVLKSMRQTPPADGLALVKLIKDQTGVDLSSDLAAQ